MNLSLSCVFFILYPSSPLFSAVVTKPLVAVEVFFVYNYYLGAFSVNINRQICAKSHINDDSDVKSYDLVFTFDAFQEGKEMFKVVI